MLSSLTFTLQSLRKVKKSFWGNFIFIQRIRGGGIRGDWQIWNSPTHQEWSKWKVYSGRWRIPIKVSLIMFLVCDNFIRSYYNLNNCQHGIQVFGSKERIENTLSYWERRISRWWSTCFYSWQFQCPGVVELNDSWIKRSEQKNSSTWFKRIWQIFLS